MNYVAENYFSDLQTDLQQLNLLWPSSTITDICHLVDDLECTTAISRRTAKRRFEAATNIGAMIQKWAPVSFNYNSDGVGICPEAEPKFIANAEQAANDNFRSPLVIFDKDEPVALAKAYGEPTIYSFKNKKPKGLLKDTICINNELGCRVTKLPRRSGAYLIELSEITAPFVPMRVSALAVPGKIRGELSDTCNYWSSHALDLSTDVDELEITCAQLMCGDTQMLTINQYGSLVSTTHERSSRVFV